MFDTHDIWGTGMGFGMWFIWLVLIVIIFVLIRTVLGAGSSSFQSSNESALDILKKRYARGEIDEQEYRRRKIELEK